MKIKQGFIVRRVGEENIAVPVGEKGTNFRGMIKLNETGTFLWNYFLEDHSEKDAVADEMLRLVYPLAPHVFAAAGPRCLAGPCPEGGMCCGKQNAVRDKYATLKQEAENHG